jgi:hypothetical protein
MHNCTGVQNIIEKYIHIISIKFHQQMIIKMRIYILIEFVQAFVPWKKKKVKTTLIFEVFDFNVLNIW